MQTCLDDVMFLTGSKETVSAISRTPAKAPFDERILNFLDCVSKELIRRDDIRQYPDAITFAFWIRKSSVYQLKLRFNREESLHRLGKGTVFHIAPSNVPVNFAYSLTAGLLSGNTNIVRVSSKNFQQVSIIANAFNKVLADYEDLKPFINLVRYEHSQEINDWFSSISDVRIVWGGDATISEIRKSPLQPRAFEIAFADRYSLAVINSNTYLETEDKEKIAGAFYNDTFLTDQNACTSPRLIVWTGNKIDEAKRLFWKEEHKYVSQKYTMQAIQAVNKLTNIYRSAAAIPGCKIEPREDNLIFRVLVPKATAELMDYIENSGFFFEYNCSDIMEIRDICNDKRCQTVSYLGKKEDLLPLIQSGVKGIDRIVPLGKTMAFDLVWDGHDLTNALTRIISVE